MDTISNQFKGSFANALKVGHAKSRANISKVKNALQPYSMISINSNGRVSLCVSETFSPDSDILGLTLYRNCI